MEFLIRTRLGKSRTSCGFLAQKQDPSGCWRLQGHRAVRYFLWRTNRQSLRALCLDLVPFLERHWRVPSEQVSQYPLYLYDGKLTFSSSFDGKVKVWSMETKTCVATHSETDKAVWNAKWLPKIGKTEGFATAGANRSIAFYREATG